MPRVLILKDYRGNFYSSSSSRGASLDVDKVMRLLKESGHDVVAKNFAELDFRKENYAGCSVLYQSSEDPSLSYKDYIEDVLLGLMIQGATLIPDFHKFRAHHNKVFMELLRDLTPGLPSTGLYSKCFGTFEDYRRHYRESYNYSVLKDSQGSKSRGVRLAIGGRQRDAQAWRLSFTPSLINLRWYVKNLWDGKGYRRVSSNRGKFIIQPYISNLSGDFKIVIYGKNYFVVRRENRPNDFRASGSGRLSFPETVDERILDFAMKTKSSFRTPFMSIDVSFDGEKCHLLEFQFVSFGQYAVEKSSWHFCNSEGGWSLIRTRTTAEEEFACAVHEFIKVP